MNYSEALAYIKNIERVGSDYGIERMRLFLDVLGKPDEKLKFVHVAGTNGKGSVCAFISSVLKEAGYKVGTYNSPSVFGYNERWRVNGKQLSDMHVAEYITRVRNTIDGIDRYLEKGEGDLNCDHSMLARIKHFCGHSSRIDKEKRFMLTAFEIETAVAMLAFLDLGCDIVVLETGLGGRWDATNAISHKELAVITPIGLDHCTLLGNTLSEIASEKAAIIKDSAVTCEQSYEIMSQLSHPFEIVDGKRDYRNVDLKICKLPRDITSNQLSDGVYLNGLEGQTFEYDGKKYEIRLLGMHQLQNAAIAICALEVLRAKGWIISEKALTSGLKNAEWNARFEIVQNSESRFNLCVPYGKTLVFDGAHNPHGALALAQAVKDYFSEKRVHLVVGMLADKDVDGAVKLLAPLASRITAVTPDSPRALDKNDLCDRVKCHIKKDCSAEVTAFDLNKKTENKSNVNASDIRATVQYALNGDCDVVILCGSLTLFGSIN